MKVSFQYFEGAEEYEVIYLSRHLEDKTTSRRKIAVYANGKNAHSKIERFCMRMMGLPHASILRVTFI